MTGYVALSRFKKAEDVLILQPFELELFQLGAPEQATILHEHFARLPPCCASPGIGAHLQQVNEQRQREAAEKRKRSTEARAENMKRVRQSCKPKATRACVGCSIVKDKDQFTDYQWKKKALGKCRACMRSPVA